MRRIAIISAVLVAGLAISGCYSLRELTWSVDRVKAGKSTTARIGLLPLGGVVERSRFYLLVLYDAGGDVTLGPARFDTTRVLGKPKKMVRDQNLAAKIMSEGVCEDLLPETFPQVSTALFRTQGKVNVAQRRFLQASLRARTDADAGSGEFLGAILTGEWTDDGDLVADNPGEDGYACMGVATTGFRIRP